MSNTLNVSAGECLLTPEHVEPIAAEMEGAFSYTKDDVKLVFRQELTQALAAARKPSQKWSSAVDDSEGVCGSISSHAIRIRRQPDRDQPPLPSIAMMDPHPVIHSPEWSFDFKVEFTSFITQPETHDHVTGNLRSLTWESSRVTLPKNTSLYGTGENAGSLLLNDMLDYLPLEHSTDYDQRRFNPKRLAESNSPHILKRPRNTVVCWNTDACFYDESFESLYQSHPYVVAVLEDGQTIGLYTDSTYRTILHFCRTEEGEINVYTISDAPLGPPLLYILHGDHPELVSRELARLTGYMALPPLWALGNQQCRYSYFPDTQVKEIADTFREKKIPCDVIWMDIHYMDEYRCFTFHPTLFPDPKGLNDYLHEKGFKSVWMIDPGIKMEKGYHIYDAGVQGNVFIKEESGSDHDRIGTVWPGLTAFPDFTMETTRSWWGDLFHGTSLRGVDGVWNDMNEIASFQPGSTIHPKSWHRADEIFGGPGTNARYHNVYGMLMTRSTREGMLKANPNNRPFVLTRANFMGGQRYSASWTGDNASSWEHLHWSIPMILNFGLSGQPFSGCDIGGFFDNASPDLFARWVGIGSLLPFCRAHTCLETNQHEPWSFGHEAEVSCRRSIFRRYRLLPHFYTQFWHATRTGLPICRPLFWTDPKDIDLRHADDSFLIGESVLVRAVTAQDHTVGCLSKMPKNHKWSRFYILEDDKKVIDPHAPEFYIREGTIVPLGPVMNHTNEVPLDPLTLIVCLDSNNSATGILYEDGGDGFEYVHGEYRETKYTIHLDGIANNLELYSWKQDGNLPTPSRTVQVILIDSRFPVRKYEINEVELPLFIPFNF